MAEASAVQDFNRGILRDNPLLVLLLGLCPALAVTTTLINGLGMGLAATFVLVMSNLVISTLRKGIPSAVRIPAFIVVIASFVTLVDMVMEGFLFDLHKSLGLFIPLIVVNCVILGRAEAFASRNTVSRSVLDGLGMGLGFTLGLVALGAIREALGNGTLFAGTGLEFTVAGSGFKANPVIAMILPPGAFLTLGLLVAWIRKLNEGRS
jgi:Na+-translocating ferredoxin:NAD+ oxidoreductase subunit E